MQADKYFWRALEHKVKNQLTPYLHDFFGKKLLLMVSGGADSVALLHCWARLRPWHECHLHVLHVHHGSWENQQYRDAAMQQVQAMCLKYQIPLSMSVNADAKLKSEEEFRDFRRKEALKLRQSQDLDLILTAHHQDDLLETRILRLLRGTGAQGLQAMEYFGPPFLRSFLPLSRREIRQYLEEIGARWVEDPTNSSSEYLRNWVRHDWLPALEKRSPGASTALGRSLELLIEAISDSSSGGEADELVSPQGGLDRVRWQALPTPRQKQALASYLLGLGVRNFRHTQVEEIRKHLDNPRMNHIFQVAGVRWTINAEQIMAEKMALKKVAEDPVKGVETELF